MKADQVTINERPGGGLEIHIEDSATDSLVVLRVRYGHGQLAARLGLRGNFDMRRGRAMRWISTHMEAPLVTPEELAVRTAFALRRGRAPRD